MKRLIQGFLPLFFVSLIAPNHANAAAINNALYHFDEFGHGNITLAGIDQGTFGATLSPDTTLGGLANWNVLTYDLPFLGTAGDVLVFDPAVNGTPILDVLRFDGNSHVIVYSDNLDGFTTPADTPGPPNQFLPAILQVFKNHVSPILGTTDFTPGIGDPGYDASNPSYQFLDPGVVPEPGTATLLLGGLAILAGVRRHRNSTSHNRPLVSR